MGRREAPIPEGPLHDFAQGLRDLKAAAPGKPTYRELAQRAHCSHSALSDAAAGRRLPTWTVTEAFVEACGGDVDTWRQSWQELRDLLLSTNPGLAAGTDDLEAAGNPDGTDGPRPAAETQTGSGAAPAPAAAPSVAAADTISRPRANPQADSAQLSRSAIEPLNRTDPARIGTFRLLGRLGGGAMGQVYLATSKAGRLVAVKVIRAHLAEDPDFRRRFAAEVAAARQVQGPYTPAVVDADPQAAQPWMASLGAVGEGVG